MLDKCRELAAEIGRYARVKLDDSDKQPGWKFAQWEMKGLWAAMGTTTTWMGAMAGGRIRPSSSP